MLGVRMVVGWRVGSDAVTQSGLGTGLALALPILFLQVSAGYMDKFTL